MKLHLSADLSLPVDAVPQAIGIGIVGYAVAVAFYTLLSVWRTRRTFR